MLTVQAEQYHIGRFQLSTTTTWVPFTGLHPAGASYRVSSGTLMSLLHTGLELSSFCAFCEIDHESYHGSSLLKESRLDVTSLSESLS